jgi:lactoylglutathione lyase
MNISGLFHSSYTISNVEKTVCFCRDVLKLENTRWQVSNQPYLESVTGFPGCSLRIGFARAEGDDISYEMVEYVQPKGQRAKTGIGITGSMSMGWEVDNLDAAISRLKAANVPVIAEPGIVDAGLWQGARGVFFLDPDGILTELFEIQHQPDGAGRFLRNHHTTFTVTRIEAALQIFCDRLGLVPDLICESPGSYYENFAHLANTSMKKAYLSVPNTSHKIEFLEYATPSGPAAFMIPNNLGSGHVCFQVDDIHNTYLELRSVGMEFVGKPTEVTAGVNKGGFAAYFKGVDGIRFELFQKPSQVA